LLVAAVTALVKLAIWIGKVEEHRGSVSKFLDEIRSDIKKILEQQVPVPVRGNSPAHLTDYGRKMAKFLQADEWAVRIAAAVENEVVNREPFRIEEFSRSYVKSLLDPSMEELVSACAYEFGADKDAVKSVLWVVLRDELFRRLVEPGDLKRPFGEPE